MEGEIEREDEDSRGRRSATRAGRQQQQDLFVRSHPHTFEKQRDLLPFCREKKCQVESDYYFKLIKNHRIKKELYSISNCKKERKKTTDNPSCPPPLFGGNAGKLASTHVEFCRMLRPMRCERDPNCPPAQKSFLVKVLEESRIFYSKNICKKKKNPLFER